MKRMHDRAANALRPVSLEMGISKHAEGSCLIKMGDTHVLCTATLESGVPSWRKGGGMGWITAEYGMLPRATGKRMDREAARGKQSGRTQEIQRLIGRALRAVVDFGAMGEMQIKVDCDVIQADGGTRTAAITGAYAAVYEALAHAVRVKAITQHPINQAVAAISCGIVGDVAMLDLDYSEDSSAVADCNFVLSEDGKIIEIQATAEQHPFSSDQFQDLMALANKGTQELFQAQMQALAPLKNAA